MKAIIQDKYGSFDVLKYEEVDKPSPRDDEVLVEVFASAINFGNLASISGKPFISRFWTGLSKPKIRIGGSDFAGRVAAVGKNVSNFKPGDEVYGDSIAGNLGAYAEFVSVPEGIIARKPSNISFEEAAVVPQAALVALQGLRNVGKIKDGQKALITGASGGNGTFAVQIAKAFGAEVTAVCSTKNIKLVKSLGADKVIDYSKEDFLKSGEKYDLILSMGGYRPIRDFKRALKPRGIYVSVGGDMKQVMQGLMLGPVISLFSKKKLTFLYHNPNKDDLELMTKLIESGKVKPVIDKSFPLEKIMDAFKYYEQGHNSGKIAIKVR